GEKFKGDDRLSGRLLCRVNIPNQLHLDGELSAETRWKPRFEMRMQNPNPRATLKILSATPVRMPPGGTARIEVDLPGPRIAERAQFELSNPPEGITIQNASPVRDRVEIVLQTDAAKVKPGLQGNLIINGYVPRLAETNVAKQKANNNQRLPLDTLRAIPFEIAPLP